MYFVCQEKIFAAKQFLWKETDSENQICILADTLPVAAEFFGIVSKVPFYLLGEAFCGQLLIFSEENYFFFRKMNEKKSGFWRQISLHCTPCKLHSFDPKKYMGQNFSEVFIGKDENVSSFWDFGWKRFGLLANKIPI